MAGSGDYSHRETPTESGRAFCQIQRRTGSVSEGKGPVPDESDSPYLEVPFPAMTMLVVSSGGMAGLE